MKKLFICALAVGMFTACSQEETLSTQAPMQISFDGAFVENATRAAVDPSITTANIANFDVWGFMKETSGIVFDREAVNKSGSDWTYTDTQYWVPGMPFYFAAVAPGNNHNQIAVDYTGANTSGLGKITFTNTNDGNVDLLYSAVGPVNADEMIETEAPVKFTFNHLLSKVKFTFKNAFANDNATLVISDIVMTAPGKGTIDVATQDWWVGHKWSHDATAADVNLAFGDMDAEVTALEVGKTVESAKECLTIPAEATEEYTVTFKVTLKFGDVVAFENQVKTAYIKGVALELGKAYNFTAELNASNFSDNAEENPLVPITFAVETVNGWTEVKNEDLVTTLPATITDMTLVADASAEQPVTVSGSFDGAGHTFAASIHNVHKYMVGSTLRLITAKGNDVTISNLTIDGNNIVHDADNTPGTTADNYGIRAIFLEGEGTFTLDNVNIKNVTYTINDDAAAKTLKVINSTLEGWTSYNPATEGTFENVTFAKGTYGQFRPHGNATLTNCVFNEGVVLDLTKLNAGKTVKLVNCKYGDEIITAENIETLLVGNLDGYAAGKVTF